MFLRHLKIELKKTHMLQALLCASLPSPTFMPETQI